MKRLAYAMLERLKELNVRAALSLPALIDTFFSDVGNERQHRARSRTRG